MKKWVLFILVALVVSAGGYFLYKETNIESRREEGKLLAVRLNEIILEYKKEKGTYPSRDEIEKKLGKDNQRKYYRWGVGQDVAAYCKDCMILPDSYRIVIYGNIDDDPEMDIMIISDADDLPVDVKVDAI